MNVCVHLQQRQSRRSVNRVQHLDSASSAVPSADLPYVVEVSVGNLLLGGQFLHLVQEDVHLKLGAQVLEATVAERLPAEATRRQCQTFISFHTVVEKCGHKCKKTSEESSFEERNSHRAVDNQGHHDVHVCNVLLEVGIEQVELCASGKETTAKMMSTRKRR